MPQIEITYDIDANGILSVSALEKSTGKTENITVTNDKGRLSAEDIEEMISNAEKYKDEDNKIKLIIDAKNNLEMVLYQTKGMLENKELKEKMSEENIEKINSKCSEIEEWLLTDSQEVDEYESKKEELEELLKNIHEQDLNDSENIPNKTPDEGEIPTESFIDEVD